MPRPPQAVQAPVSWTTQFERFHRDQREPAWTTRLRKAAFDQFQRLGFPTVHQEPWRYTNVEAVASATFRVGEGTPPRVDEAMLAPHLFPDLAGPALVLVNGAPAPSPAGSVASPAGLRLTTLTAAASDRAGGLEGLLTNLAPFEDRAFNCLNTAFWRDGAFLDVPPGLVVPQPVHVLHFTASGTEPAAFFPRVVARIGANAHVRLIETYAGAPGAAHLTAPVTEIWVGEGATVEHYKIQREPETHYHIHETQVEQGPASHYTHHNVALGGALARTELGLRFAGEGAECTLNGLYVLRDQQLVDSHTFIDHALPRCNSREFYKGILDEKSHAVFYGKILVRKDAAKTNSGQINKNLLVSDGALVDSIPALEINHNDVKCSHGSAIGQIDRDAIFYLQTRGLDAPTARSLLTYAFARELVGQMTLEPVRTRLEELLLARLPHGNAVKEVLHAIPT